MKEKQKRKTISVCCLLVRSYVRSLIILVVFVKWTLLECIQLFVIIWDLVDGLQNEVVFFCFVLPGVCTRLCWWMAHIFSVPNAIAIAALIASDVCVALHCLVFTHRKKTNNSAFGFTIGKTTEFVRIHTTLRLSNDVQCMHWIYREYEHTGYQLVIKAFNTCSSIF